MEVGKLSQEHLTEVYYGRMVDDFPEDELRYYAQMERLMREGRYPCFGLYESGDLVGYACFFRLPVRFGKADYLLDYFAIREDLRGKGYGSQFMGLLGGLFADMRYIFVEIEDYDGMPDGTEKALRERRWRFYRNAGVFDTGLKAHIHGVDYRVLLCRHKGCSRGMSVMKLAYENLYRVLLTADEYQMYFRWK